ncbi:MAG: exonuclease domain-containing protein [bacterium]
MQKIIFFDTETTGNTEKDFLCQLAYKVDTESFCGLYKPPIKIPAEASAIHHITNKMVESKSSFSESSDYKKIKNTFEEKDAVVVAHNALFDLMIIKKENIIPKNFICTLRLARHLDPEAKIGKYNLQYLRYLLDLEVEATAHDALGDVLVLEKLYERLKKKLIDTENLTEKDAVKRMIEISSHPSIFKYINFGKHNGKELKEIAQIDSRYLEWLLAQKLESDQIDEDWIYTLKHYLGKL